MSRALLLGLLASTGALAAPVRLLLSIGNDVGASGEVTLHHAQTDAERVRDVFVEVGNVDAADAVLLREPSAEAVRSSLLALAARASQHRAEQRDVTLLVYVSSHAQAGTLHLGSTELPMRALREAVDAVPARVRVLVVDACTSGSAARFKGGQRAAPAQTLELQPSRGTVVISSSGPAEPSQEWDSLGGSLFTHHWVGALRGQGDADGDGRVTLLEAYGYAWRQTVARADQHPTYDFDLQGTSDVVLTEPRKSPSALLFSAALSGRLVVASEPDAHLVLELDKASGEVLRLAVPPGSYQVRHLRQPGTRVAFVELPWGRVRALGESDFSSAFEPQVALKGGGWRGGSAAVEVSLVGSGLPRGALWVGTGLLVRADFAGWWTSLTAAFGSSRDELQGTLGVGGGLAANLGGWRFALGLFVRGLVVSAAQRSRWGVEGGPLLSLELTVLGPVFVGAQFEGMLRALEGPSLGARGALLAGFRL